MKISDLAGVSVVALVACAAVLLVVACDDDGGVVDSAGRGDDGGSEASAASDAGDGDADAATDARVTRSPAGGRPAPVVCGADPRPPGDVDAAVDGGECSADDDCDADADAGAEARCRIRSLPLTTGFRGPVCTYHACTTDQDCPGATSVCGCGVGWAGQNLCLTSSNCRVDADCPTGQRCAFSDPPILRAEDTVEQGNEIGPPNFYGDAIGWFCTTPEDDCACPKSGSSTDKCIYNLYSKHWDCGYTF